MDVHQAKTETNHEELMTITKPVKKGWKPIWKNWRQIQNGVLSERKEVHNDEAAVETIGALEDRHGDQRLAVRCRGRPKKRTQDGSGPRQKLAAAQVRLTRRAIPALRKGRSHREPDQTTRPRRQELRLESKEMLYEALG
jgi:hypothetical protein